MSYYLFEHEIVTCGCVSPIPLYCFPTGKLNHSDDCGPLLLLLEPIYETVDQTTKPASMSPASGN